MTVLTRAIAGTSFAILIGWVLVSVLLLGAAVVSETIFDTMGFRGVLALVMVSGVVGVPIAFVIGMPAWFFLDRHGSLSPRGGALAGLLIGALFLTFFPLGLAAVVAGPVAGYAAVRLTDRFVPRAR